MIVAAGRTLLITGIASLLAVATAAHGATVDVTYSHRFVPHVNAPPAGISDGDVFATFTGSEPITPSIPDPDLVQLTPSSWQYNFAWNWSAPKSVDFVTATAETIPVTATPSPLWALDPVRHSMPVLHIETDSSSLWDPDSGIYTRGNHMNFVRRGSAWERLANMTWYGADDLIAFSEPIGLRIHGGQSRQFDQKGLRFYFDDYGTQDDFVFDFFGSAPTTFQRLIIRQARRPLFAINTKFTEGLFADQGHLHSRDQFVAVYLNDEYWGGYELRERLDDEFFEITHGYPKDEFIAVKDGEEEEGDIEVWWSDLEWFGTAPDPESHAWFVEATSRMDLDTYIDWLFINVFLAAADNGFDHNVAQVKLQDEPWHIVMWDEDSVMFDSNLLTNHFLFYSSADAIEYAANKPPIFPWPWTSAQQRWSTMFRQFLKNPEFRARFFGRAQDLMATDLSQSSMTARLDAIAGLQEAEMTGDHEDRWGVGTATYPQEIARQKAWLMTRRGQIDLQIPPFYESWAQPVELSSFVATAAGGGPVDLTWRTEREIDNQGFVVLRGVGTPDNLVEIASWENMPALVGAGTSTIPSTYAWTDSTAPGGDLLFYVLRHVDAADSAITHPWIESVDARDWTGLVLNELGAENGGLVLDEAGDPDPWLELVNTGPSPVALDSLWLSDDPANLQGHQMVGGLTLSPGARILLWADGETTEGSNHVAISLSAGGGQVALSQPDGATPLDIVPYAVQFPDHSYGRWPDANGPWSYGYQPTPGTPNVAPQLPRFAILNEVQTDNVGTLLDELGEADAWVEIANPLPVPLAVGKLELTSAPGSTTGWPLPDSTIAASGYQIVWVDGEGAEGPWHADFALPLGGGFTGLVWSADSSVVDSVTSVSPGTDWSFARIPDSVGPWTAWDAPSPGAFNPVPAPVLFVNEFLAKNDANLADEAGDFDDWVEIYNPNGVAVDMTGMHLTDDASDPLQWQFPPVTIEALSFLIVWCDNDVNDGPLHTTFKLSGSGEDVALFGGAVHGHVPIDSYTYGIQSDDISEGRETDGASTWVFLAPPKPGAPNGPFTGVPQISPGGVTLALLPAAPNPFGSHTSIRFVTPRDGHIRLDLFDVTGRRVAQLLNGPLASGSQNVIWDGRDGAGRRVATGVYFVRLRMDREVRTTRIVRVR